MPDLPSRTELFNVFADEVLARASLRPTGRQITSQEVFTEGSDVNLIGAAGSAMGEEIVRQLGRSSAELSLDGAVGEELDRWAQDRYGVDVPRKGASPALVSLSFARPNAGAGAFTYPVGARVQTAAGVQFELTTSAPFSGTATGPITATARAVQAGPAGNVAAGTITSFVTAPTDATLTVTNPSFAAGGDETEADDAYRERVRRFFAARVRGTLAAIEFGALTVPGIRQAVAVEETSPTGALTGAVTLYIADVNAQANQTLVTAVALALREWRAGGIPVDVVGAVPLFVTITYQLDFEANVDTVLAFEQVRQVTVARVNQLAPNEPLRRAMLFEAARSIAGVVVPADGIAVPAGDVIPTVGSGQVFRTRADLVTNT